MSSSNDEDSLAEEDVPEKPQSKKRKFYDETDEPKTEPVPSSQINELGIYIEKMKIT